MSVIPPLAPPTGTSRRNLLRAFRTSAAGALVTYAVNLAIVPFVLHRVGATLYGAWATVASILAVGALADAGVRTEIIRRVGVAQGERDDEALIRSVHEGVTLLAALAAAVTLLGVVAAPAIRAFAFPGGVPGYANPELDLLIRATVAVLATSLVVNGYFGVLRGVQRADVETVGQMLAIPVSAAVTAVAVSLRWGLWGLFLGSIATLLVTATWSARGASRVVPDLRPRLVALTRPVMTGYLALSGLALLSQIGDVVDSQWDKVVLSRYVGSAAVTSFQIGTNLVQQGKALALLPLAPLLVSVAELRLRDEARMESLYRLMARAGAVVGTVVLGGLVAFAPSFVRLWLDGDPSAGSAGTAARLFSVAVALNLIAAPLAFRAFGEGWHVLAAASAGANMALNGVLSLVLTMSIGFNGALYGSIAGNLAGTVVFVVLMHRRLGDRWIVPPWKALAIGSLATGLAVVAGAGRIETWPVLVLAGGLFAVGLGAVCAAAERLSLHDGLRVLGIGEDR
jgi:O-antigen/teichoic acid export membrane protein